MVIMSVVLMIERDILHLVPLESLDMKGRNVSGYLFDSENKNEIIETLQDTVIANNDDATENFATSMTLEL